ncbi:MAG: FHA domain-containing protein [Chloroflexota bacterium]
MVNLLFILRLLSAAILLSFIGFFIYMVWRDMQMTERLIRFESYEFGQLIVTQTESQGIAQGTNFGLKPVTSIGRGAGNVVVLTDTFASTEHALITKRGPRWWIEDLGSSNGTLLNDQSLSGPTIITSGDIVMIGSTKLRVELEPATISING